MRALNDYRCSKKSNEHLAWAERVVFTHKADTDVVNVDKNEHLARAERVVFTHKADTDTINVDKLTMMRTPV